MNFMIWLDGRQNVSILFVLETDIQKMLLKYGADAKELKLNKLNQNGLIMQKDIFLQLN